MLISFRKGACALAAALTLAASAAPAKNVEVLIVDGSYFPAIVYVNPGDNVIFRNNSGTSHTVNGPDETWTSGSIASDGMYRLNISHTTPLTFSGDGVDGEIAEGEIIFGDAPID